jgi:hypothetical protein
LLKKKRGRKEGREGGREGEGRKGNSAMVWPAGGNKR